MMDTLVRDRLVQKKDVDLSVSENLNNQRDALKHMLHNFGLVQQSLFDVFVETISEPSVQGKLYDFIETFSLVMRMELLQN